MFPVESSLKVSDSDIELDYSLITNLHNCSYTVAFSLTWHRNFREIIYMNSLPMHQLNLLKEAAI